MKGVWLAAFGSGVLFALGLGLSGMTLPEKVIGFLDFTGDWDPSLAFVMGGAVAVYGLLLPLVTGKRKKPVFGPRFLVPTRRDLTPRLVIGAGLFGMGWGLGGFCPGPALTSLPSGGLDVAVFTVAMLAGMGLFKLFDQAQQKSAAKADSADAPTDHRATA